MRRSLIIYITTIILSLVLTGCNTIERRSEFPVKKPLEIITNEFKFKKIFHKKIVNLNAEQVNNLGINLATTDQALFTIDLPNSVIAINNNKIIWKKSFKFAGESNKITAGPVYDKEKQQLFIITSEPKLVCLSAIDGKILWDLSISSNATALPVIDQDLIFIHTLDGGLTAISSRGSKELWRVSSNIPHITLNKGSTPLVSNNYVVNGFASGKLFTIDKFTGSTIWALNLSLPQGKLDLDRIADLTASPVIKNDLVYAVSYQGYLVAAKLDTGEEIWKKELSSYAGFLIESNKIYIPDLQGKLFALDQKTGKTLWVQDQLEGRILSKPIKFKNYIIVGDEEGGLHFIDHIDGTIKGRIMLGNGGISLPINIKDNNLQVLTNDGYLVVLELS